MVDFHCWKCGAELDSRRAKYCPRCGIVRPIDGGRKRDSLRALAQQYANRNGYAVFTLYLASALVALIAMTAIISEWDPPTVLGLSFASFLLFGIIPVRYICRWYAQQIEIKSEAFDRVAPEFAPQNSLLRAASACTSTETLLRPAASGEEHAPEDLLRAQQ